ncbi:rod-binding protein [Shimia thalassica]|uniref:Chemotactic signal-response protein CheL n=1 Tax=Shimia thalassica TaxID=1715693 RepID=A0A0P1IWG9_9RHOB|nr:rod-binding protein [Shimia thalassica]MDO6485457.1 rod-binding protein [Shimia thalassica]MDO6799053.1 rod-binding protein [Shimia thalassica]MDP2581178.1 rod-binding protein [Shimia thalassica]CUK12787.1 chemotactic signal-response protein CheL [Shimia thalassica]
MIHEHPSPLLTGPRQSDPQAPLRKVAQDLEATFLSEMLKSAGFGETSTSFGGGAGEDQFASFLRNEHAAQLAKAGGIGLAETIFESLKETSNEG